jgi:sensor domain DACNV-containing protein
MTSDPVQFPRDIVPELHRRVEESKAQLVRPVPSVDVIRTMVDVAYAASMLEVEGRRVRLALGFLTPAVARALNYGVFRFRSPLSLEPSALAKAAMATESLRTALGVQQSSTGAPEIWGMLHHGDRSFGLSLEHKPPYFSVRVLRAGTFTVDFDERLILLFARDHARFFDRPIDLLGTLRDRAGINSAVAEDLVRLAQRMLAHGHGGTILVARSTSTAEGLSLHQAFSVDDGEHTLLKEALAQHEDAISTSTAASDENESHAGPVGDPEKQHNEALDFVARLSAVDGAVVVREDLTLLGFGATISTTERGVPDEVSVEDPTCPGEMKPTKTEELGGTRHRSAACFCAQQRDIALAIVASQDGDLSVFIRHEDGRIHCLRPYELGIGL